MRTAKVKINTYKEENGSKQDSIKTTQIQYIKVNRFYTLHLCCVYTVVGPAFGFFASSTEKSYIALTLTAV